MKHYSFQSSKEPTDKQLRTLMKEVAKDANAKSLAAKKNIAKQIEQEIKKSTAKFKTKK